MTEFVEKYIIPLVLGGGGFATLCLIVVPILLRYVGKLRRAIKLLEQEKASTKSIGDMLATFNADIEIIKARADYSDTIKREIADSVKKELATPIDIMQKQVADMQRQVSVCNDNVTLFNKSALIAWGSVQERGVGESIKKVLSEPVTQTVLYKQELANTKLKDELRKLKGDEAESIIAKVLQEVESE